MAAEQLVIDITVDFSTYLELACGRVYYKAGECMNGKTPAKAGGCELPIRRTPA